MLATCTLENRLAELMMAQLAPCDLGDGIEVVHDVEDIEIELECDLGDAAQDDAADRTLELSREAIEALDAIADEAGTHEFVRFSAPYERIELELDSRSFLRATIEDASRARN